jgi:hypothetical protein
MPPGSDAALSQDDAALAAVTGPRPSTTIASPSMKQALNAVRLPTGRPGPPGLPGWKGLRLASCC